MSVNNNLVQSQMRLMDCFFKEYKNTDAKTVTAEEVEDLEAMLEPLFVFAIIWSIGCTTTPEGRKNFSDNLRQLMGKDNEHRLPAEGSVYDYCYMRNEKQWLKWDETVNEYVVDPRA